MEPKTAGAFEANTASGQNVDVRPAASVRHLAQVARLALLVALGDGVLDEDTARQILALLPPSAVEEAERSIGVDLPTPVGPVPRSPTNTVTPARQTQAAWLAANRAAVEATDVPMPSDAPDRSLFLAVYTDSPPRVNGAGDTPEAAWNEAVEEARDAVLSAGEPPDDDADGATELRRELTGTSIVRVIGPSAAVERIRRGWALRDGQPR